jgi:hypothetical protein
MTAIDRTRQSDQTRPRSDDLPRSDARFEVRETKPSLMTTEFWAMLAGIIVIVIVYNASADRSLDLFRAATLATILAVGYFVSRGLAKSGTTDTTRNNRG